MKLLLLIVSLCLAFLVGCSTTASKSDIERATAACGLNGEVVSVRRKHSKTVEVVCGNGAMFTFNTKD